MFSFGLASKEGMMNILSNSVRKISDPAKTKKYKRMVPTVKIIRMDAMS
jgi:hypothetical protein